VRRCERLNAVTPYDALYILVQQQKARVWERMDTLSQRQIEDFAQRYGVSSQAVTTLLQALMAGNGTMAQFSHPELGGLGQWSRGGMTMIGDMFNDALKAKVDGLCSELASLLSSESSWRRPESTRRQMQTQSGEGGHGEVSLFVPVTGIASDAWWESDLGPVTATGSQNNIRYAYFSAARRLAIKIGADVAIYDTEDHQIGGISQQQTGDASLTFVSQHGLVRIAELRAVPRKG
jgi:hypothetical protein